MEARNKKVFKNVCKKVIVFTIAFFIIILAGCSAVQQESGAGQQSGAGQDSEAQQGGGTGQDSGAQQEAAPLQETGIQPEAAALDINGTRSILPDTGPAQIAPDVSFEIIEADSNGIIATGEVAAEDPAGGPAEKPAEDPAKDPNVAVSPRDGEVVDGALVTVKVILLGQADQDGTITIGLTSETLGASIIPPEVVTRDLRAGETVLAGAENSEFDFTFKAPLEPVKDLVVTNTFAPLTIVPEIPDPPPIPPQSYTTSISIPLVNGNAPAPAVANPAAAKEGETVRLPAVTANAGFTFSTWRVASGGVALTNPASASGASFIMGKSNVTVEAVFVPATLTFANQALPNGTFGVSYSANVTPPTGGSGLFTYTATMPFGGITMSQNGSFSGTPNAVLNAQTFNVTATDARSGASATAIYTLSILKADQSLTAAGINTVPGSSPVDLSGHVTSSAGADSGLITYSVANAGTTGAVVSGTKLSFTSAGTAIIRAMAAGSANFNQAQVEFMLVVTESASASISPASATFDRYPSGDGFKDIQITMTLAGNTLESIREGNTTLTSPGDYTINGNVVIIKKEFLRTLAVGNYKLTFVMNAGRNPELSLTVTESYATPDPNQPQDDSPGEPVPPANGAGGTGGGGIPVWAWFFITAAAIATATILIWRYKQRGER